MTKRCIKCKVRKSVAGFTPQRGRAGGLYSWCKKCKKIARREWYRRQSPKRLQRFRHFWIYKLTAKQYHTILASQRGKCAICGSLMRTPCIDHDHKSNQVRGLLCRKHNAALGLFGDSPSLLRAAAEYIEKHNNIKPVNSTKG